MQSGKMTCTKVVNISRMTSEAPTITNNYNSSQILPALLRSRNFHRVEESYGQNKLKALSANL